MRLRSAYPAHARVIRRTAKSHRLSKNVKAETKVKVNCTFETMRLFINFQGQSLPAKSQPVKNEKILDTALSVPQQQ